MESELGQGSEFTIRLNNRKVLTGLLEKLDLADKATEILRALDKLAKNWPVDPPIQVETGLQREAEIKKLGPKEKPNPKVAGLLAETAKKMGDK